MDPYERLEVEIGKGWERDRRKHFDEIVVSYDKARWEYPCALFEDIIQYHGKDHGRNALEIGAGTGKATTPFLDAGFAVTAVEMGANMAAFLQEKFKETKGFLVVAASFEDAALKENTYDLVYAASAFHWVDAQIGCPKALRLLKRGGTFALFRSNVDPADGEPLYEEIQEAYKKHYFQPYQRPVKKTKEDFSSPSEILRGYGFEDLERYGFADVMMKLYDVTLTYGADKYIALMDTMSDHRSLPEDDRAALYGGIKKAIGRHGGYIQIDHVFQLYMGKKGY